MPSVCLYFHVHQPSRLRKFSLFDIGKNRGYFDEELDRYYLDRIVKKSYLPTNRILLDLIGKTQGRFRVSFSITGVFLEQLERYYPEVIKSFQELINTGAVEIISETYYHSLAYLYSKREFKKQVRMHKRKIKKLFNYSKLRVFRNTELMCNNEMACEAENMGFLGILSEGADHILGWRSPNFLYRPKTTKKMKLLLRNYRLSDDISFRFSCRDWSQWPLTADKFASWVNAYNGSGQVVNLFMDYETFGEHQWEETGIFDFLKALPYKILEHPDNNFKTPSELIRSYEAVGELDIHNIITWADVERDLSAWFGNEMQRAAIEKLYSLEDPVIKTRNKKLLEDWRKLQVADHFYYMCTKWFADGDVHKYFNPYESPYDAFTYFMNILKDMEIRLNTL